MELKKIGHAPSTVQGVGIKHVFYVSAEGAGARAVTTAPALVRKGSAHWYCSAVDYFQVDWPFWFVVGVVVAFEIDNCGAVTIPSNIRARRAYQTA